MNIEMVNLRAPHRALQDEIDEALHDVIDSSGFIRGKHVERFERDLAGYLGASHAHGVGSGTDALQVAFMALGLGAGDEVITTPFTFVATAEAAALLGATPVLADIDPHTFNLDPEQIEPLVTERTEAIVPVNLFGQSCDMNPILEIAREHDLAVVEDNAQAIGATYDGEKTGTLGDVGCFSFFPSKNLGAMGDGGALTTDDEALYDKMAMIAGHGSRQKYQNELVGVNSRLDAVQAAVLRVKLQHLDKYNEARRAAAGRYDDLLTDVAHVETPPRAEHARHVFHQYTLRLTGPLADRRDVLRAHLNEHDIPHSVYYPTPIHRLPAYAKRACYDALPEAERAARTVLSLPMHTELTEKKQAYVADAVREFAASA
jgi:dTDP-4-amino-4,6-dideoxygalactose transaminase